MVRKFWWLAIGFAILIGLALVLGRDITTDQPRICGLQDKSDTCTSLEVANTPEARERGLSFRDSLAKDQGMLFEFPEPQLACLWMRDMRFNIDIVWVDEDGWVLKVEENVSPDTYPESFCVADTVHVIELPAGRAKRLDLTLERQLDL